MNRNKEIGKFILEYEKKYSKDKIEKELIKFGASKEEIQKAYENINNKSTKKILIITFTTIFVLSLIIILFFAINFRYGIYNPAQEFSQSSNYSSLNDEVDSNKENLDYKYDEYKEIPINNIENETNIVNKTKQIISINKENLTKDNIYEIYCPENKSTIIEIGKDYFTYEEYNNLVNEYYSKNDVPHLFLLIRMANNAGYDTSGYEDKIFDLYDKREENMLNLANMSIDEIEDRLIKLDLNSDQIGYHLYYLGFAYTRESDFDEGIKYYGCSGRVYNNPFGFYRVAQLYHYGTDGIKESFPDMIINKTYDIDHPQAFFFITTGKEIDLVYSYGLNNAGTNMGWNTIAMVDSYVNSNKYGFNYKEVVPTIEKYILERVPEIYSEIYLSEKKLGFSEDNKTVRMRITMN